LPLGGRPAAFGWVLGFSRHARLAFLGRSVPENDGLSSAGR
jgi:hypothetical protein